MIGLVVRYKFGQDEGLEKPRSVSKMPLRRTHIFHRLDDVVLYRQRLAQPLGQGADLAVAAGEAGGVGVAVGGG